MSVKLEGCDEEFSSVKSLMRYYRKQESLKPWYYRLSKWLYNHLLLFPYWKIRDKVYDLKFKIQRFNKGYSSYDVSDIDYWFFSILPCMLTELKASKGGWFDKFGYVYDKKKDDFVKVKRDITYNEYWTMVDKLIKAINSCKIAHEKFDTEKYNYYKDKMFRYLNILFGTLWR